MNLDSLGVAIKNWLDCKLINLKNNNSSVKLVIKDKHSDGLLLEQRSASISFMCNAALLVTQRNERQMEITTDNSPMSILSTQDNGIISNL